MNQRKALSMILALVLILALAVPALAAEGDPLNVTAENYTDGGTLTVKGKLNEMKIQMEVPTSAELLFNPYGLVVDLDGGLTTDNQVIFTPVTIKNKGNVDIDVGITAVAEVGDVAIATTKTAAESATTKKTVFLEVVATTVVDASADDAAKTVATVKENGGATKMASIPKTAAKTPTSLGTLAAGIDGDDGDIADATNCLVFAIDGALSPGSWTNADAFNVTIAYTFTPKAG